MGYVVGVDPDSEAHGIAIYDDGALVDLFKWTLPEVIQWASQNDALFSIENVMANKFIYGRNITTKAIQCKIAMSVGRCQQSQVELERALKHHSIEYQLHKPMKGNWAKNSDQFKKVTGWAKRSNEDTRSAAFFGWLALK